MPQTDRIDRWLADYLRAWSTDAPADIARLFTPDARYSTAPYRPPLIGADAIATWWIEQRESHLTWTFDHEVVAREGDRYVVRGTTIYDAGPTGKREVYHNLWLVTLAEDGRAREFVEYWMLEE